MPQAQRQQMVGPQPSDDIRTSLHNTFVAFDEPGILDWLEDVDGQGAASRGAELNERLFALHARLINEPEA